MRATILVFTAICTVIVLTTAGYFIYTPELITNIAANPQNMPREPQFCVAGFKIYQNLDHGFELCIPEDAEVLTQFDSEDMSVTDLVFVRHDDLPLLQESPNFGTDPYFAVIEKGVSAFALKKLSLGADATEEQLKALLPQEIPCPDKSLSCVTDEILQVAQLSWDRVDPNKLLFGYSDRVSAKTPWEDYGFIGAIGNMSYQIESVHPHNPIKKEALQIIAESFRAI